MTFDNILEKYFKKYKLHFRVQAFYKEPKQWVNYATPEYKAYLNLNKEPNHREIMPDEVVLDIDADKSKGLNTRKKEVEDLVIILKDKLKSLTISFSLWRSGGDGFHFHLFFPQLMNYPKYEREDVKKMIIRHIGYGHLSGGKAHICSGGGTLIQIEGRYSRKGGRKIHIDTVGDYENNELPLQVLKKYEDEKEKRKHYKPEPFHSNELPSCIKFLNSEDFLSINDGWNRASFILASYYKSQGKTIAEVINLLSDWNEYTLSRRIDERSIRATARSVFKGNRHMSCRYRKALLEELGQTILCKGCRHDT